MATLRGQVGCAAACAPAQEQRRATGRVGYSRGFVTLLALPVQHVRTSTCAQAVLALLDAIAAHSCILVAVNTPHKPEPYHSVSLCSEEPQCTSPVDF